MLNQMPEWLTTLILIGGVFTLIHLPTVLAARFEKRMVWPYEPLGETPDQPAAHPYTSIRIAELRRAGFQPLGAFRHGGGGMYRIRYYALLSPEGDVLAITGAGTIASIPVMGTYLITPLSDGRRLITIDSQSISEIDLTGLTDEGLVAGADLGKLLERHRGRMDATASEPTYYSEDALADHFEYRASKFELLAAKGYAVYLDPEQNRWRYSLKGAFVFAFKAFANGYRRVFWPDSWTRGFKAQGPINDHTRADR